MPEGKRVYVANAGKERVGRCVLFQVGNRAVIQEAWAVDEAVLDGILRAALFWAMQNGSESYEIVTAAALGETAPWSLSFPRYGALRGLFEGCRHS